MPMIAIAANHLCNFTCCIYCKFYLHYSISLPQMLKTVFMKYFLFFLTFIAAGVAAQAQTAEDSVKAAVNKLFEAMKKSDATMLAEAFGDSAVLQTIGRNKEGQIVVQTEKVAAFAASISRLPAGAADEQIVFETIKIDGPLAVVWTPYKFYLNGKFNHCGVNSFQLVRFDGVWKIQYIIDTRRRQGCN
jgi:hypothetical protein